MWLLVGVVLGGWVAYFYCNFSLMFACMGSVIFKVYLVTFLALLPSPIAPASSFASVLSGRLTRVVRSTAVPVSAL